MAKKPNKRTARQDAPMNAAMKLFLAGCVVELYILIVNRFYINGTLDQIVVWAEHYLKFFMGLGAGLLAGGLVVTLVWRTNAKLHRLGSLFMAGGALFSVINALMLWHSGTVALLYVLVPVVMLLIVLWSLYDRECAMALTVLGVSLIALWLFRRTAANIYLGTAARVCAVIYLVVVAVVAILLYKKKLVRLLGARADLLPVYVACGLSAAAIAAALISTTVAYYSMWALAIVVFALAVYYTVKQL